MKRLFYILFLCSIAHGQDTLVLNTKIIDAVAYGAAYNITGGRGGTVYHVTNRDNTGTGSLRDAVSGDNRIVVFDVSGIFNISSLVGFGSNISILGSTAPQGGVVIDGQRLYAANESNIFFEGVSFIGGDNSTIDAITFDDCASVFLMNCEFRYGVDESLDLDATGRTSPGIITVQWNLFGEGSKAMILGADQTPAGGVSILGNIGSNMGYRLPKSSGDFDMEILNNVWHNFYYLMMRFDSNDFNLNQNYNVYQAGSDTGTLNFNFGLRTDNVAMEPRIYSYYNFIDASVKQSAGDDNADDWDEFVTTNGLDPLWFIDSAHSFSWRPYPLKTVYADIMGEVPDRGPRFYVSDLGTRGIYQHSLNSTTITQIQTDSDTAKLAEASYGTQPSALPTNTRGGGFYSDDPDLPQFFIDDYGPATASTVQPLYTFTNYDTAETFIVKNDAGYTALEIYHMWTRQAFEFLMETGEVVGDTTYSINEFSGPPAASGTIINGNSLRLNGGNARILTN